MAGAPGFRANPDYRVDLAPHVGRVRVVFNGEVVADSERALDVLESHHRPVIYVPGDDVRGEFLEATSHTTHCPFKGDASYWTLRVGDRSAENAVWGYDEPFDEVRGLAGYRAFYRDRVDAFEER